MFSTSLKVAFGYILLIGLLFGAIGYIYKQMGLLISPAGMEDNIGERRRITHRIISQLYETEIIGQTLRSGKFDEYYAYKKAMRGVSTSIDSLQFLLADTLQQARLDTVRTLLKNKEKNMLAVLEVLRQNPTDELYRRQMDSLVMQQDSLLNSSHVRRRVVTHHNTYVIHHKPKKFFRRLADVFSPGKADSTQVNNVIQEEYTDTIDEAYNPIDTLASILTDIQDKVFQTRQEQLRMLDVRINRLRVAGSRLSQRVNQLLDNIEKDEQKAADEKLKAELHIREQAAWTIATIAILAVLLVLIFFTVVWRDITRSNHYRKELEKSKLYAEDLLVAREKLMLTITHDIKAPAGSIIGYIDLLIRLVKDKRQLFYLENMRSSAHHLLALITSLLDYHRLEAGKMDLHPVAFSPHELFETIHTSFLPLAEKKGLSMTFDENVPRNLMLEGDPFRIRQIAENLLSNALKFTACGNITLHTDYDDGMFGFSIADSGCGMTPKEQERIFQEFIRLRSAQGQEGFGLGLPITKKLVELLGGKITVESTPGKGSTFRVSMPLPSTASIPAEAKEETLPIGKQLHILLIDDDRIQLNLTEAMLHNLLDKQKHSNPPVIQCCEQPEELFELLRSSQPFDFLFTDIQMPSMNGFELLKALRGMELPQLSRLPVIAITARSDMSEDDFRAQGFAGCLYKPFSQSDLLKILRSLVSEELEEEGDDNHLPASLPQEAKYNFSPLTAFSEDDPAAAREIMITFIQETVKSRSNLQQALAEGDMESLCATAHKMLPIFTMIEAKEAIASLQWLETQRGTAMLTDEAKGHAATVLHCTADVISSAKDFLSA